MADELLKQVQELFEGQIVRFSYHNIYLQPIDTFAGFRRPKDNRTSLYSSPRHLRGEYHVHAWIPSQKYADA